MTSSANAFKAATIAFFFLFLHSVANAAPNPTGLIPLTTYVNPFDGTGPGTDKFGFSGDSGDVFPGALWPRGMVQFSPDTPSKLPGGYDYRDSEIKDFSITHFSGRGCVAYQDVPVMPIVGSIGQSPALEQYPYGAQFSHSDEVAHPGYYRVQLATGIIVELTATEHTGFARFTFPQTGSVGTILVNSGGSVNGNANPTEFTITGADEVSGCVTSHVGCGGEQYSLYFITKFNRPFKTCGTWSTDTVSDASRSVSGALTGAYMSFDTSSSSVVLEKTGISYVSLNDARENLEAENAGWDFSDIVQQCSSAWNRVLNRIKITTANEADKGIFYSCLYHTFIHPNVFNDVNGEYIGFDNTVHTVPAGHRHYENIPGWDCYRSLIPLQALLAPRETSDVAQSLVDDALQGGGGLPRWEQTNHNSAGMCGDSDLIVLATAYAYGARDFDTTNALNAMKADASGLGTKCDGHPIREGLNHYLDTGYIPGDGYHSASATLEYCSDDFALSQFAAALGDKADSSTFLKQAQNWKNLFNPSNGYISPRNIDGSWKANFDPASEDGFVEGSGAQYTWAVPFNLATLFHDMGGNDAVVKRLDKFFMKLNDGPDQYAFMGNEPCFEVPWEYDWAGDPAGTQGVVRRIQNELFSAQPNGLPGNDDGGATSSWYVWSAIGLYSEIPGYAGYTIGSPRFSRIVIDADDRPTITILAPQAQSDNPYVVSLTANGKQINSPWIPWSVLSGGGTLAYELGPNPTLWGSSPASAPPSFDETPNVVAPPG